MKNKNQRYFTEHLFKSVMGWVVFLCLLMLFISAQQAFGVSCHCFKERAFKPSQPASADPYILATARNSLLAAASGIEKRAVVRQRMTGVSETDLWLSNYLSTLVDKSADQLLRARDSSSSWSAALDSVGLETGDLGTAFHEARRTDDADGMARALADPVLGRTFNTGEPTLERLRENGANIAESALSLYLAARLKRTPESLLADIVGGKQTWGSLFNSLDVRIDTVGDVIGEAVRKTSEP